MDFCEQHYKTVEILATMSNDIAHIRSAVTMDKDEVRQHITESVIIRDTVKMNDKRLDVLERDLWKVGIVSGLIGGLVSQLTPEVFQWIINLLK